MRVSRTVLLLGLCLGTACGGKQKKDDFVLPGQTELVVEKFDLEGVEEGDQQELKDGLKTQESTWRSGWAVRWMPVVGQKKEYFNYVHWRQDLQRIRTYYSAHGYFDASIVSERISESPEDGTIRLSVGVDEGPATKITAITVDGLSSVDIPPTRLLRALPLREGATFSQKEYLDARTALRAELERAGYAYATVHSRVIVEPPKRRAHVYFFADPGPLSEFGEIEVVGNKKIPASAIRDAVTFEAGERYSPDELQDTQERIYDLGVFSVVKVSGDTSPLQADATPDDADAEVATPAAGGLSGLLDQAQADAQTRVELDPTVPVRIYVSEAKLWSARAGVGGAAEVGRDQVHARADWTSRNFFGGLRKLEHFTTVGYARAPGLLSGTDERNEGPIIDSELRFTQPQFLEKFTKLETRLRFEREIEPGFSLISPSAKIGLRRRFFDNVSGEISYNFLLFLLSDLNPALLGKSLRLHPEYILEYFQQRIDFDRRNDRLSPTRGFLVSLQLQEASSYVGRIPGVPTGGHFDYLSPSIGAEIYFPYKLVLTQVLALRARVATIYNLGAKQPPIPQRLYSGGVGSMRSFGRQQLSVWAAEKAEDEDGDDEKDNAIPIGGLTKFEASVEPRFRLVHQMFEVGDLWFAPFFDAATVLPGPLGARTDSTGPEAESAARLYSTLLYGVGVGAWWNTPVGPLRADFAYTLSDITTDPRFRACQDPDVSPGECPPDQFKSLAKDPIQGSVRKWNFIIGIAHSF